MKKMITFITTMLLLIGATAFAATINVNGQWTYNGTDDVGRTLAGFRMYQTDPNGLRTLAVEIADPAARVFSEDIEVIEGRSIYNLVAYTVEGEESPDSEPYPFEYMIPVTSAFPAPQVIIRFQ